MEPSRLGLFLTHASIPVTSSASQFLPALGAEFEPHCSSFNSTLYEDSNFRLMAPRAFALYPAFNAQPTSKTFLRCTRSCVYQFCSFAHYLEVNIRRTSHVLCGAPPRVVTLSTTHMSAAAAKAHLLFAGCSAFELNLLKLASHDIVCFLMRR